jgi:uncharacterized protein (TIGR02588 family)
MASRRKKPTQAQPRRGNEAGSPSTLLAGASEKNQEAQAIPTLEWIVGGIGFLIVAGVLGLLLYAAINEDNPLPEVKLSVDEVRQLRTGYLVRITVINDGGLTAEGVIVEGELRRGAELVEQSRTVIEFVPSRSRKRAGLFFSRDPREFELKLRPHGYEEP